MNRPLSHSMATLISTIVFLVAASAAAWSGSPVGVAASLFLGSLVGFAVVAVLVARECKLTLVDVLVPRARDSLDLLKELRRMLRN